MTITLANRVNNIQPSPTLAITSKVAQLKAEGKEVISLGAGEPDFDTPAHVCEAAKQALDAGKTRYTPVGGDPALKAAILAKLKRDNQLDYTPKQVLISTGAKQSLYNLFQAVLNPGDEVLISAPYWVSYPAMATLAEATPVIIETGIKQNFKITPELLEKHINSKTKLFVINSPSNPSGQAYTEEELAALAKVLLKHPQVIIATDDIYEHIMWSQHPFANILMACPALYDRTVVINGASKVYAMTGWRIGYAAGPEALINGMKKLQSQSTSCANSIAQAATIAALESDQGFLQDWVKAFKSRHDLVVSGLNKIEGIECAPADGTFYAFPNVEGAIKKAGLKDDVEFVNFLLENASVAVVPGSAFGCSGYIRLSYAADADTLKEALQRIEQALSEIAVS